MEVEVSGGRRRGRGEQGAGVEVEESGAGVEVAASGARRGGRGERGRRGGRGSECPGRLWKVLLVEPQGGDPGKSAFSEISSAGERPWLHEWSRALSHLRPTCLTALPLSMCRLRV